MKTFLVASLIVLIAGSASAQSPERANASGPLRSRLTREVIKEAVQQTLADGNKDEQHEQTVVFNAQRYEKFARQFADARIPDCLHSQALKYQPTFLTGVYAAPFVVLAALRGKCR